MKELAKKELEEKSLDVLHFLDLDIKKNNMPISKRLEMILKMYKYVVQNIRPLNSFGQGENHGSEEMSESSEDKKRFAFEKLRQALINNPGDSASNVILFYYLLYLKGYKSSIVLSESKHQKGEVHLSNLVEVTKDDWYFFDPSLERINFVEDQYENPDDFSYSWAGLGMKHYSKFYRPVLAIKEVGEKELPISAYSISEDSVLRELVDSVGKQIPDLTYRKHDKGVPQVRRKLPEDKEKERDE